MDNRFPETAGPKIRLLQGPIYSEDNRLWKLLLDHEDEIRKHFHDMGTALVVDPAEGYAFIEQMNVEHDEGMPQLFRRRQLSFEITMLLVLLREELVRFDSLPSATSAIPTVQEEWLVEQMSTFQPERKNQVKGRTLIDQTIRTAVTMGILRETPQSGERSTYQIMRIVKAKLTEAKLSEIRTKLAAPVATEEPHAN